MSNSIHQAWPRVTVLDRRHVVTRRPNPGTLGYLVRQARMDLDISQATLARMIGMTHSYISRIESNERAIDKLSTLLALAEALQLGKAQTLDLLWAAARRDAA